MHFSEVSPPQAAAAGAAGDVPAHPAGQRRGQRSVQGVGPDDAVHKLLHHAASRGEQAEGLTPEILSRVDTSSTAMGARTTSI